MKCPVGSGQTYTNCGTSCQTTCHDLAKEDEEECESECVFGCQCPNGTLLDNQMKCVEIDSCSCYDKYTRKHYDVGKSLRRKGNDW